MLHVIRNMLDRHVTLWMMRMFIARDQQVDVQVHSRRRMSEEDVFIYLPRPRPPTPSATFLILYLGSILLNMGAFLSISGTMRNLTLLPRIKMCSIWVTLPSRPVAVTLESWIFQLSSASWSSPLYISPVFNSTCMCALTM